MATALIGYSGFVGGALLRQTAFDARYNSANIAEIEGRDYELVVCAGAPAVKWQANRQPEADWANLSRLMNHLGKMSARRFLLVSTVDVYPDPRGVNEDSPVDESRAEPYGRHRHRLEEFVRESFSNACVVRLPGLFGEGLKKNFVYDLLHKNCLHLTHAESVFQFYDLSRLWADLQTALRRGLPLVNFATEPVSARDVAARCFGVRFENVTETPPASYDMRTKHAALFGGRGEYFCSAEETFERIRRFAASRGAAVPA
jgi:nucleoside-diphosphate-sugar epimerase